jgi:hypothetical protein
MRAMLLGGVCLALVACGGSNRSPTTPTPPPIPPATLVLDGQAQWVDCFPTLGLCVFRDGLRNTGTGCAANVRGVTRFIYAQNQESAPFNWNVPASAPILRPNEVVAYQIAAVPYAIASTTTAYRTESSWDDVRCP